MAFTGTAAIQQISDDCVRITGLSLAGAANGTIGLHGSGAGVELPEAFQPAAYTVPYGPSGATRTVDLAEALECRTRAASSAAGGNSVYITKSASTGTITITNTSGSVATADLEIYVEFLG